MNEKTRNQINEMKKQTIGVEIEMNNITRQKAAKIAATFFGTGRIEYTANRNGYMTWSAWDAQGREWKFSRDVSISGPDDEKCEMVTPILTYADIEGLQELCRQLRRAGAKSDATRGCGVHIHIGAKGHTPQTLRNLANIMASHESLLAEALKLDRSRMNRYCRTVDPNFLREVNRKKPTSMARLADIWYTSQGEDYGRSQHYNGSKTGSYLTIEKADGFTVPVGVWAVSEADEKRLDCYEGYPHFYYKENLDITYTGLVSKKVHRVNAFVYIMQEDRPFGIPSHMYVSTCSQGYTDFGFNQETLAAAYAFSKKETLKQWDIIL